VTAGIKPSHRGLLHREMGVPGDKAISIGALMRKRGSDRREAAIDKRSTKEKSTV
jgi:hypothetical protein